jgi:hypothetical protein
MYKTDLKHFSEDKKRGYSRCISESWVFPLGEIRRSEEALEAW